MRLDLSDPAAPADTFELTPGAGGTNRYGIVPVYASTYANSLGLGLEPGTCIGGVMESLGW